MFILIFFVIFFCFLAFGVILIIISSNKKKGIWGINTETVVCPKCGDILPKIRKPKNIEQALWGGWTCDNCGCEIDKWGKEIKKE